jgi:Arc/MetJ-type ribon-helix-helix transcriptional regulator
MTDAQPTGVVELPTEVLEQIDHRVAQTEFEDTSAYVTHLLEEVLYQLEHTADTDIESVDEQQVQERLKSLGYLNE